MRIGFTGTRQGMTAAQERALRDLLAVHPVAVIHHGDCVGADERAHDIAVSLGCSVVIHPPVDDKQRAFKPAVRARTPRPYLVRNKAIVRETDILIAAPAEASEQHRSGTWSTVRFARRQGRAICIIQPDGTVIRERAGT
jgi:hypothetical protein